MKMWQFTLLAVGIQLLLHCNTALPPDYCHCNTYSYEYMYQATSGIVELPGANLFTASLSSHEFLSGDGDQMLPDARIGPMICTLGYGATRHRQRRNLVNSVHIVSRTSYIFTRYSYTYPLKHKQSTPLWQTFGTKNRARHRPNLGRQLVSITGRGYKLPVQACWASFGPFCYRGAKRLIAPLLRMLQYKPGSCLCSSTILLKAKC